MPHTSSDRDDVIEQALALAQDIAEDLDSILITVYPDADTLDTLRPGETDIETATAVARAVAAEMAASGVEVFVQRADKSAFRRWMQGRADTPENRWTSRSASSGSARARMRRMSCSARSSVSPRVP